MLDAVRGIDVLVERMPGILKVGYALEGDLEDLLIPPPGDVRGGDKLWQHTCFELFLSPRMPAYREFNFSPSREWAAYAFGGYRQAMPAPAMEVPSVSVRRKKNALELDATIQVRDTARLAIAVSAVVKSRRGELSYWALRHPPGKPDFHHPDAFALELDEIRN